MRCRRCFERRRPVRDDDLTASLQDISKGCKALSEVDLPPGSAQLLVDIRRNLRDLQGQVQGARAPVVLPWARPLREDQQDWEARCPVGGRLLRAQVCVAALEVPAEEWVMGRLFISESGIFFEGGGGILPDSDAVSTGLLLWADVAGIDRPSEMPAAPGRSAAASREVLLTLRDGLRISQLQLQLSIARDCEWLAKAWRACLEAGTELATGDQGDTEFRPLRLQESTVEEAPFPGTPGMERAVLMLPTEALGNQEPLHVGRLPPEVTMAGLREILDKEDWFLDKFCREVLLARDMNWEPFLEPARTPGVKVRRCAFVMPLPQDVPKAVASIIGLPKESNITIVYHMKITDDEIMLVHQTLTHDVMYGDQFRAQDMHIFRQLSCGGVEYRKWGSVVWLGTLPWTHGIVKSAIDAKTVEKSKENVDPFVRTICGVIQPH